MLRSGGRRCSGATHLDGDRRRCSADRTIDDGQWFSTTRIAFSLGNKSRHSDGSAFRCAKRLCCGGDHGNPLEEPAGQRDECADHCNRGDRTRTGLYSVAHCVTEVDGMSGIGESTIAVTHA